MPALGGDSFQVGGSATGGSALACWIRKPNSRLENLHCQFANGDVSARENAICARREIGAIATAQLNRRGGAFRSFDCTGQGPYSRRILARDQAWHYHGFSCYLTPKSLLRCTSPSKHGFRINASASAVSLSQ